MDLFTLSRADLQLLRRMIYDWQHRRGNTEGRTPEEGNDPPAPEVYVALTPEGGIPAVFENQPGYAECAAYTLRQGILVGLNLYATVYNLATTDIPEDTFVLAVRDKGGHWWAAGALGAEEEDEEEGEGTGSGTGTEEEENQGGNFGTCSFANLKGTDCVLARSGSQEVTLYYNEGRLWDSVNPYTLQVGLIEYPSGAGMVELWYEAGRLHLAVDGKELLDCGDGCFTGGPLTGHTTGDYPDREGTGSGSGTGGEGTGLGTGTGTFGDEETGFCDGTTFTVCLTCAFCEPEDEGTGSGSGDGAPPVVTLCCEGAEIPATLFLNLGAGTTGCECAGGVTVELNYNDGTGKWEGGTTLCDNAVTFAFYCYDNPSWALDYTYPGGSGGTSNVPSSCGPFLWTTMSLSWPPTVCNPGGGGGNTDNITVTE